MQKRFKGIAMYKFLMEEWAVVATLDHSFKAPEQAKKRLMGKVYKHPAIKDSTLIITSELEFIKDNLAKTFSGSVYELGKPSIKYEKWLNKHLKIKTSKWKKIICWIFGHKYPTDSQSYSEHLCTRCGENAIQLN
jgi:cobalamin biosynthesis Co2+ chelatase CbiK